MAKPVLILCALAVCAGLAACGVDGEPVRPSLNAGVGVSSSGVHAGGSLGLHKGPLSVYLGV
ncbi:hypothetical protein K4F84_01610 [Phaeobacter inhibens]|uniref:hypothetical protein n=1 Tax=Phaeobacter inhibens TaxID=221822 RepID=UPI0021A8A20F|nr:hypothetical protein [Phaeobacter inhibens]UWR53338.1 hypothetical protein K4F84_01610 [Phaeobacter inhibens]UWR92774.1 hypothetical protein K4K96_01595 [Phaeobacter inhibens]